MDIVTLGAAKAQTEKYVSTHFVNGANITITDNADGTQTIAASGEVSSEDTVARGEIADHVADKTNPHEVTAAQVGLGNVDNTSDANKPVSTATQAALDLKANTSALATVATTGAYSDLSGTPTIPTVNNSTITIQKNGATVDSFTTNASSAKSINITVPTTASDVGALADTVKYAGSSSAGGSATSAVKLDNAADAGSLTQPIFFESGKPKATTYSLGKSVPSNAVFTDTTYSFEGTYNASTNKAATMADIKDGKLTGYAQASGDVAATDKVVEAIGKLEKKADDNKNNILSNKNNGYLQKNRLYIPDNTYTVTGLTVVASGGELTYTSTNATSHAIVIGTFDLPAGEYYLTDRAAGGKGYDLRLLVDGTNVTTEAENAAFTLVTTKTVEIRAYSYATITAQKIRPMIISAEDYNAGLTSYTAYAMSNAELTAKEQVNENNILYNTNNGVKNLCKPNVSADSEVTYTVNADNSITITCNTTALREVHIFTDLSGLTDGKDYILSGCNGGNYSNTYGFAVRTSGGTGKAFESDGETTFTKTAEMVKMDLIIRSGQNWTKTFYPMIRPAYISDTTYQPYALSNAELTALADLAVPTIPSTTTLANYAGTLAKGYHTAFIVNGQNPSDSPVSDNCFVDFFVYSANTAQMRVYPTYSTYAGEFYVRTKVSGSWGGWYKFQGTAVN